MSDKLNAIGDPVTTDITMLYDNTNYKIYFKLKSDECSISEIKAVAKVCNINYIEAKNKLINKKNFIVDGDAFEIKDYLEKLSSFDVVFEIVPPYPYKLK